ncbi:MAG: DUF4234 domain-containing protein [Thermoleophilia bacterium]|nr:DUF4234 domain-containing protein [Thermoleophilia bacterium]
MDVSSPAVPTGNIGPLGKPRSVGLTVVLILITLGIYGIYWAYKTHDEIKKHSDVGVGGVVGLVIWMLVTIVSFFIIPSEVRQMNEKDGRDSPVRGTTGLWNLLILIGTIIWLVKVQGALNRYWESKGAATAG